MPCCGYGGAELPRKNKSPLRWVILACSTLALLGPYYSFDVPAATQQEMRIDFMGSADFHHIHNTSDPNAGLPASADDHTEFNVNFALLYSLYSFPNMLLPLIGGLLVDSFGAGRLTALLSATVTAGAFVGLLGLYQQSWPLLFVGRIIFGALESLTVSQRILVTEWFLGGKELALGKCRRSRSLRARASLSILKMPTLFLQLWVSY